MKHVLYTLYIVGGWRLTNLNTLPNDFNGYYL